MTLRLMLILSVVFLASCVSQSGLIDSGKVYKGISKEEVLNFNALANQFQHPFAVTATRKYFKTAQIEIIAPADGSIFYVFESVTIPSNPGVFGVHGGNGRLHSWHSSMIAAQSAVDKIRGRVSEVSENKTLPNVRPKTTLPVFNPKDKP